MRKSKKSLEKERARKRNRRRELRQNTSKYNKYKINERFSKLLNKQKIQKHLDETRQSQMNPVDTANESSSSTPKRAGSVFSSKQTLHRTLQKQPSRSVLNKRCSENMQQIQLYWNRTSAWVFSCKFAAYFQNTFS